MYMGPGQNQRVVSAALGAITLAGVAALLAGEAFPALLPARSHAILASLLLALIAIAYLVHQIARRPAATEIMKAIMLAVAFLFWAANQFRPDLPASRLFNDLAIALFVLDVFLVIAGWPRSSPDSSFAESCARRCAECGAESCAGERCCAGPISVH